jgi:3-dehydroquinate synthase class II
LAGLQVIPAENMVAAFQDSNTALYATASTASDAQVYLEALEMGTDGVVLHTDDPLEVFSLKAYLDKRRESNTAVKLVVAVVTRVEAVGMGDRVCVDLCNLLRPGEGLLVC